MLLESLLLVELLALPFRDKSVRRHRITSLFAFTSAVNGCSTAYINVSRQESEGCPMRVVRCRPQRINKLHFVRRLSASGLELAEVSACTIVLCILASKGLSKNIRS
jgi:hypothetical protein